MNLGLKDAISLGPVLARVMTEGSTPATHQQLRSHMARRRESAIEVISMAKFMAGAVGMSPKIRGALSWMPINLYTVRDWVVWALGKSSWISDSVTYRFSGLGDWDVV